MFTFLNISGTPFQTNTDTLKTIPLFEAYFENINEPLGQSPDRPLFLDRDAGLFESVYMKVSFPMQTDKKIGKTLSGELMYYGIVDHNSDSTEEDSSKVEDELEILMGTSEAFYVNACGKIFVTCKPRLIKMDYFKRMFEGGWKENSDDVGTRANPLFLDIPPKAFECILASMRNSSMIIPDQYEMIANVYGIKTNSADSNVAVLKTDSTVPKEKHQMNMSTNHGGLMQLVAAIPDKSAQNTVFGRKPHNFTNIARDHVDLRNVSGSFGWGKTHMFIVTRNGDMVSSPYLYIDIGDVKQHVNWSSHLKYRIIDKVTLEMGDIKFDEMTGQQLWAEEMLFEDVQAPDFPSKTSLVIPLRFFFKKMEEALPMIALQYSEVTISVKLSEFVDCVDEVPEGLEIPEIDSMFIKLAYYYLDTDERRHKAQSPHVMHIHQRDSLVFLVPPDATTMDVDLSALKRSIEMIGFTLHNDASDPFVCSDSLVNARMLLNGHERFAHDNYHLKVVDKIESNMNLTKEPIYTYSICPNMKRSIHVNESVSSMNCERLDVITMKLNFKKGVQKICLWTIGRNVCLIQNGYGLLKYTS